MSCIFRTVGENFDVDAVLRTITVQPYNRWHKGEALYKSKPDGKKRMTNGCTFTASDADFDSFHLQAIEAAAFLKDNYEDLQVLTNTKGIDHAVLDFGFYYDESKSIQSKHIPLELIKLCAELNISIELSIYAPASEE